LGEGRQRKGGESTDVAGVRSGENYHKAIVWLGKGGKVIPGRGKGDMMAR